MTYTFCKPFIIFAIDWHITKEKHKNRKYSTLIYRNANQTIFYYLYHTKELQHTEKTKKTLTTSSFKRLKNRQTKTMIATIPYIEKKFDEFNQMMFAGKLPKIPIVLSDAKSFLGQCACKKRKGKDGKIEYYDFKLRINTRLDLPENEIEDTLIHEMIHYYIGVNRMEDVSAHGPLFIHMMNTINEKYGRNITISFKGTKEQKEQLVDKKQHYHVVAVVRFHNGKVGLKVLPRVIPSILKYYNALSPLKEIQSIHLYMCNDIFFNRFPNSAALKVHYVDEEEILGHLKDAESLTCDGKNIIRKK